jgi:FkbM family methyltransferase
MSSVIKQFVRRILPKAIVTVPRHDRVFMLRYVARSLDRDSVVVEIGAGRGGTLGTLKQFNPDINPALAHLIEPDQVNVGVLAERWPMARRHALAIVGRKRSVVLYSTESRSESDLAWKSGTIFRESLKDKSPDAKIMETEVAGCTLDEFIETQGLANIGLLYLNCEGAEYEIFETLPKHIDLCRFVWIELHGNSRSFNQFIRTKIEILDRFERAGFTRVAGARREDLSESFTHSVMLFEVNRSANRSPSPEVANS